MEQEQPKYRFFEKHLIKTKESKTVEGFAFDQNDFENLIDDFTPYKDIPMLLGVRHVDLDRFCQVIYGLDYKATYDRLLCMAQRYQRAAIVMLAKSGNQTALKMSASITGVGDSQVDNTNITFISDVPIGALSDEDRVKEQEESDDED